MDTYFASPEKSDPGELIIEIDAVSKSQANKSLLHSIGGLLAILNEHRQVVALNDSFICLLLRVLNNMIINVLEATEKSGIVRVWSGQKNDLVNFCVWNSKVIPPEISIRLFQRNFSTKSQAGRGIGTYSMKLFGEKIIGGKVSFTSSEEDGTVFKFSQHL